MKINILGTDYNIAKEDAEINSKLRDAAGLCEMFSKRIILDTSGKNYVDTVENFDDYCHAVLRHEAFHAIFHELGLTEYSKDETLVEVLALNYQKIKTIMDKLDVMNIDKI